MFRRAVLLFGLVGVAAGCCHCPPTEKQPMWLLEWTLSKDEEKKKVSEEKKNGDAGEKKEQEKASGEKEAAKKNGDWFKDEFFTGETKSANGKEGNGGNGNGEAKNGNGDGPPFSTDRPDFTETTLNVGVGRVQFEGGYTFLRDRANGQKMERHSYPELAVRVGLFADWFEFRAAQNFINERTTGEEVLDGGEDVFLAVRFMLTEQQKILPETALSLNVFVPTGGRGITAEQVMPGLNFLYSWTIIEDCLDLNGSIGGNRALDDDDHYFVEVFQSISVAYTLTEKLGMYTEWFAFYPAGAIAPDTCPEHYFDGGFTYLIAKDFQLDIRAGVGLNEHALDFFGGVGFAKRF